LALQRAVLELLELQQLFVRQVVMQVVRLGPQVVQLEPQVVQLEPQVLQHLTWKCLVELPV
jgi:hypothetical protein